MIYRGIPYQPVSFGHKTVPSDTPGVYRGVKMLFPQAQRAAVGQPLWLTYRGVKYCCGLASSQNKNASS